MSPSTSGRIVGSLFLAAFLLYGTGSALADRPVGIGLILLNSAAVATIGALTFGPLRSAAARTARVYLAVRLTEAVLLGVGALALASGNTEGNAVLYGAAMVVLGAGSIPFCLALGRHRWAPRWFGLWGAAGYLLLTVGAVLEFAVPGTGIVLAVPGGLFEVALGLLLLRRGFPDRHAGQASPPPATVSASKTTA